MKVMENNTIVYMPKILMEWPGLYKPMDEPHCGYDGSKCPRAKGNTEIAAGVLGRKTYKSSLPMLDCVLMVFRW